MRLELGLSGELDVLALRRAVGELGRRHPNLCAAFVRQPAGPRSRCCATAPAPRRARPAGPDPRGP
ncbi:hypothetical protein NQP46_31800 [Streptomyces albus]|nr:hypothetical protein NQP46_31800 [Streptomyces albus]